MRRVRLNPPYCSSFLMRDGATSKAINSVILRATCVPSLPNVCPNQGLPLLSVVTPRQGKTSAKGVEEIYVQEA